MDQDKKDQLPPDSPKESSDPPTPTSTRVFAWIGVIFMVLLVLGYTYSVATGKIFLW